MTDLLHPISKLKSGYGDQMSQNKCELVGTFASYFLAQLSLSWASSCLQVMIKLSTVTEMRKGTHCIAADTPDALPNIPKFHLTMVMVVGDHGLTTKYWNVISSF